MKQHRRILCALLALPAVGAGFFACSSSSTNANSDGGLDQSAPDGSAADVVVQEDTSVVDTGTDSKTTPDTGTDAGPNEMHFIAINDLLAVVSPVRLCFAANASSDPGLGDAVAMNPVPPAPGLARGLLSK